MPARSQRARVNLVKPDRHFGARRETSPGIALADQATSGPGTRKHSRGLSGRSGAGPVGPLLCCAAVEHLSGRLLGWLT